MARIAGKLPVIEHKVDVCVVGGGMAGLCAAIAAARHGAKTVLMHERPVLGGNASSELRVHVCGAERSGGLPNLRETGILEELRLENLRRNPLGNYSIWDVILYEKAQFQPNLTLLLNCSCTAGKMSGDTLVSVTGWQLTTQTFHRVKARIFADCSGDAILAPLTGAGCRRGHEARAEYGESIAPEQADQYTMGMTCLFQAREYDTPQPFIPPAWAYAFDRCEDLPYGAGGHDWWRMGYWWVELGGQQDSIGDTERCRDELLRLSLGVWDHIKNRCPRRRAENWALEWVQFLPAKRESRRYLGAHVLTQGDIESEGHFEDLVAYGGWTMDDHHSTGFWSARLGHPMTVFHPAPSPYGIPYRALYSRDVANLMFAGRCASGTHAAMSSARVMGTGCSMGQAIGTAAALATRLGVTPAGVLSHVRTLQQLLLRDDCYLPWVPQELPELTRQAQLMATQGDPEPVRDGINRPVGDQGHAWTGHVGDHLTYQFAGPRVVRQVDLTLESDLATHITISLHGPYNHRTSPPPMLLRDLRLDGLRDGQWTPLATVTDNYQRHVRLALDAEVTAVRLTALRAWEGDTIRVYRFEVG